jgi:hypothetical protein
MESKNAEDTEAKAEDAEEEDSDAHGWTGA